MTHFNIGETVRGMYPVQVIDPVTRSISQLNLVDHHSIVVAILGSNLLLAYAGTDDDSANVKRPGYIGFPTNDVNACVTAGWKFGKKFFIDAGRLAFVPANQVTLVGKLSKRFAQTVVDKAGACATRQSPLTFRAKDAQLVTGARRQDKSSSTLATV